MKKIKWGIIGLGKIARIFAKGFSFTKNSELVAVASKKASNLNYFKNNFSIKENYCFNSYKDLVNCPDVDIVYISLPNSYHYEWIMECLKANKNVFVEKPAVTNFDHIKKLQNLLKNKEIFFSEAFMYRHCPHIKKLSEEIKKGTIGKINHMESSFHVKIYNFIKIFGLTIKKPNFSNRLFNLDLGGGSILDLGCYPVSLSTYLNSIINPSNNYYVKLENIKKNICPSGVDISSSANIKFNSGFTCKVSSSFENKYNQETIIYGDNGNIKVLDTWSPNKVCEIELNNNSEKKIIKVDLNENIYSYEISNISDQISKKEYIPYFPSINVDEIMLNTSILEKWVSYK